MASEGPLTVWTLITGTQVTGLRWKLYLIFLYITVDPWTTQVWTMWVHLYLDFSINRLLWYCTTPRLVKSVDAEHLDWNSSTLATSCEELTHWKRLWCWEGLGAGEEGDDRGWDGWMASLTRWTWVWVNSGSLWWTGRPGVLWFMGYQRVEHKWATELNWTEL